MTKKSPQEKQPDRLSPEQVHEASREVWQMLHEACKTELAAILNKEVPLTAATITAVTGFLRTSGEFASSQALATPTADRMAEVYASLPVFDDDPDDGSDPGPVKKPRGRPKKVAVAVEPPASLGEPFKPDPLYLGPFSDPDEQRREEDAAGSQWWKDVAP